MRIAVIGKSAFGADVFRKLIEDGHNVVVACTELDKNGRPDLLGKKNRNKNIYLFFSIGSGKAQYSGHQVQNLA